MGLVTTRPKFVARKAKDSGNHMALDRQTAAAFRTTTSNNPLSSRGSPAREEPMASRALSFLWLIGNRHSLHNITPEKKMPESKIPPEVIIKKLLTAHPQMR
jgi:hypothetical protein